MTPAPSVEKDAEQHLDCGQTVRDDLYKVRLYTYLKTQLVVLMHLLCHTAQPFKKLYKDHYIYSIYNNVFFYSSIHLLYITFPIFSFKNPKEYIYI